MGCSRFCWARFVWHDHSVVLPQIRSVALLLMALACVGPPDGAFAQSQVTSTLPQQYLRDGFYEMFGLHWGFRLGGPKGGVFFDNGGYRGVTPGFGGFDPNSAARFGFARGGTNGGFYLDFVAGQGNNRSMVTSAPMLTMPQGGVGSIWSGSVTPFVTGWVPVVGQGRSLSPLEERLERLRRGETPGVRPSADGLVSSPTDAPTPEAQSPNEPLSDAMEPATDPAPIERSGVAAPLLAQRASQVGSPATAAETNSRRADNGTARESSGGGSSIIAESSAGRSELSVAEIRRMQAEEDRARDAEIDALVEQARQAELEGKTGVARIYYQQAARLASGQRQRMLSAKARQLQR